MLIFLSIVFGIVTYIVGAGATHGYAKHRWPDESDSTYYNRNSDPEKIIWATVLWPGYWIFIWPFTKTNEVTFSQIEKGAALEIARKKARVEVLRATRAELQAANEELERAEVEVEKEVAKL